MPAYVIVMVTVEDPEMYRKYTDRTPPTIARYGGRFLTRGGAVQTLEGTPHEGPARTLGVPHARGRNRLVQRPRLPVGCRVPTCSRRRPVPPHRR